MMDVSGKVCPALLMEEGLDVGESGVRCLERGTVVGRIGIYVRIKGQIYRGWGYMLGERGTVVGKSAIDIRRKG